MLMREDYLTINKYIQSSITLFLKSNHCSQKLLEFFIHDVSETRRQGKHKVRLIKLTSLIIIVYDATVIDLCCKIRFRL